MTRNEKKTLSIVPGSIGVNVIYGDIAFAIKEFKTNVKSSGKLASIKTSFEKKSTEKKRKMDAAKFEQYIQDKRSKK